MKKSIAALLTCHNRRQMTLDCLKALYDASLPSGYSLSVFLVDDGSTDGTGEAVKTHFPQVNIIKGNGNLFWNQGMRLAWETAVKSQSFNFYLWLNDDTLLDKHAIIELLDCNSEAIKKDNKSAVITGACRVSNDKNEFSYGGRTKSCPIIPNGKLQLCKYINGNAVLIPREVYKELGNLSPDYTHAIGDFDYGMRALKAGFNCYTTKTFVATCPLNEGILAMFNPQIPLIKRFKLLHSPKGWNIKDDNKFRKKFWGWKWIIFALKTYLKTLSPSFYSKISD